MVSLYKQVLTPAILAITLGGPARAADTKKAAADTKKAAGEVKKPAGAVKKPAAKVSAADHAKGKKIYETHGCPTCHGKQDQWKSGFKVTFPNTKALVGYSNAVKAESSGALDEPGYIEHFVTGVLKQGKGLTPDEDKVMKASTRNPAGINLMLGMIRGFFTPLDAKKEADIKAVAAYIRAYRKSPEAF